MLLITGAKGQLGTTLGRLLPQAIAAGSSELDITDAGAVNDFVRSRNIDLIINCAAYTAVDKAEDEPDQAYRVNATGPKNLAQTGAAIIHISTDYVFDGTAHAPYSEETSPAPASVYGKTKLAGEYAVLEHASAALVIRTSWLYSPSGSNFVTTILRLGSERDELKIVADQTGSPTSCLDLARAIAAIIPDAGKAANGIYHYSNEGVCSWYEFAVEIARLAGLPCRVTPIETHEYPTRAARPRYSVLDKSKFKSTFGIDIPHWKESLRECLKQF